MNYPKHELAQLVIAHCVANEIEDVVISPGSRNAPLTIGFFNHPKVKTYSIVDERCAGFFALGVAQQKRKPVCVVCTSGSALLNYYPAVAESFYSNVPLIVISADRPKHKIDIGDGQTIRQENVFKNHSLFDANLVAHKDYTRSNTSLINEAFLVSIQERGPVHINIPFEEPLYELIEKLPVKVAPFTKEIESSSEEDLSKFAKIWNVSKRKLILVGANFPNIKLQEQLSFFAKDDSVLVFTETTSNLHGEHFINSIDKLIMHLSDDELRALRPDILLTLGGMVISKKVKQFLRNFQPTHHWHIDEKNTPDTYFCLEKSFKIKPTDFLKKFYSLVINVESSFKRVWLKKFLDRKERHNKYIGDSNYSDLKVFESVVSSLPENIQLQLGNSSIIRYAQLFDLKETNRVFCNRGTSGIDGSTSTAIGAALVDNEQTVFISGDISFFYDSNALWNKYIPKNFRIIIINNSGGGIFRFIPGPTNTSALDYFETSHNLNASHLCVMFKLEYYSVDNVSDLKSTLEHFYKSSDKPKLLEVFTPNEENAVILKEYFKYISL